VQYIEVNEAGESVSGARRLPRRDLRPVPLRTVGDETFCDGSHKRAGFDGTETASREPFEEQAKRIDRS
jgi:hypothetical protein